MEQDILQKLNNNFNLYISEFEKLNYSTLQEADLEGETAFMIMCARNVDILTKEELDYIINVTDFSHADKDGWTPIMYAASSYISFTEEQWSEMIQKSNLKHKTKFGNIAILHFFEDESYKNKFGKDNLTKLLNELIEVSDETLNNVMNKLKIFNNTQIEQICKIKKQFLEGTFFENCRTKIRF